jgi:quinol-cytochrome oxidoreductase complex cytochrome b subunit
LRKRRERPPLETAPVTAGSWLRERLELGPVFGWLRQKTVPVHRHSWIYLLGGAALFLFACQVATGCLLMLYYQPTEAAAHASVRTIVHVVPHGWLVRSLHVWGAHLFIGTTVLHFLSVLFTRAYRKPRELTWVSGMVLLVLTLAFGFSGYLLPWNELSYHATLVGTSIPGVVPGLGNFLTHLLRGGEQVSGETITRFFAAHVAIVPLTFGGVLAIHLLLVQVQGMSLPLGLSPQQVRDRRPFFSEFVLIDAGLWLAILGVLVTLAVFLPAEIGVQADPLKPAPEGIKPEWYFLFMFQTLKWVPETLGVTFYAIAALFLFTVPWCDRNASREQRSPWFTALFLALLAYAVVLETYAVVVEIIAWLAPGATPAPAESAVGISRWAGLVPGVILFWGVIGFLLFYLWQLLRETTRIRRLYEPAVASEVRA